MNKFGKVLSVVGGTFIVLSMLIMVANILSRAIIGVTVPGTYEMAGLCAVLFVSVSIPVCTLAGSHIAVEFIADKLPRVFRIVLDYLARILDCLVGIIFAYAGYKFTVNAITSGQSSDTLSIPEWPFRTVWLICSVLIAFFAIYTICRLPAKYKKQGYENTEENGLNGGGTI